jgi:hypothetical protein
MAVIKNINAQPYREVNCFLVGGQSNADGRNALSDPATPSYIDPTTKYVDGVFAGAGSVLQYALGAAGANTQADNWGFVQVALHLLTQAVPTVCAMQITRGDSQLAATPFRANGSWNSNYTSISDNSPRLGQQLQEKFEGFKGFCDTNGITLNVKGMIWHQGESDNFSPADTDYATNWNNFVSSVRTYTGEPSLPIFYGTVPNNSADYNLTIRNAMLNFAAGDSNAYCRDNNDLVGGIHWDGASSVTFGTWVYDTYIANYG